MQEEHGPESEDEMTDDEKTRAAEELAIRMHSKLYHDVATKIFVARCMRPSGVSHYSNASYAVNAARAFVAELNGHKTKEPNGGQR